MQIDLTDVRELLESALRIADSLDMLEVEQGNTDRGRDRNNQAERARITREITRCADTAMLASSELRLTYWKLQGNDDPRGDYIRTEPMTDTIPA